METAKKVIQKEYDDNEIAELTDFLK